MSPTIAFLPTAPGHRATFSRLVAEIAVVAALESTIEPTTYLLHEVARSREAKFELSTRVCAAPGSISSTAT